MSICLFAGRLPLFGCWSLPSMMSTVRSALSRAGSVVYNSSNAVWHPTKELLTSFEKANGNVVKPATRETSNTLFAQWISTTIASIPNRVETMSGEIKTLHTKMTTDLTVAEVAVACAYVAELYAWFKVGECVGRGSTNGYKV